MVKNLTVGNPALLIVGFTVPLLIGNLFQQFYNMADTLIVGRTIGVAALAAVGCTGSINFLIMGFMMGFTQGLSITTSQRFGAGDRQGVKKSFATSVVLGACMTALLMLISVLSARPLLVLLNTPQEIFDAAYAYIIVIYWGFPAALLFNICSNMMRAVGDSVTPLIALVIACIINIILDFTFILIFKTGVEGAAYATVIAQIIAGLLCVFYIIRKFPTLCVSKEDWKLDMREIWGHIRVALPMGFQMSIIAIGAVAVTFALNNLQSSIAIAAFAASQKIDMVASMPLASFGAAMTTYSAQNFGAKRIDRIKKGVVQCFAISGSFSLFMGALYFFAGRHISALFLGAGQTEAVELSHFYLKINGSLYIFLSWLFIARQSLQGLGNSIVPTIAGIMELFMRTFAAIFLSALFGFTGICFASPLAWFGACIPLTIAVVLTVKKLSRKYGTKKIKI
ncbi:MAG: MATE family efflux transporter [Treponema sp.]|jgi:putative MATE family efflux protein|nr:MATE family efflux transporter [Treponema sp.]